MRQTLAVLLGLVLIAGISCKGAGDTKPETAKPVERTAKKEPAAKPKAKPKPKMLKKYLPAKVCKEMFDKYSANLPQLKHGSKLANSLALLMGNTRDEAFYTPRFNLAPDKMCATEELQTPLWATDYWTIRFSYLKTGQPNKECEPFSVAWNADGSLDALFVLARMALRNGCKPLKVNLVGQGKTTTFPPVSVAALLCPVEFENPDCGKGDDTALFTLDLETLDWQPAGSSSGKLVKLPIDRSVAQDLIYKWVGEMLRNYKGDKFAVLADKNAKVFALWAVVDAIRGVKPNATVYLRISGTD